MPYPDGTSGFAAGSKTSEDRARQMDARGATSGIKARVLECLEQHPPGLTWKEVDTFTGLFHHGQTSGALSNLKRDGKVVRLNAIRGHAAIWVTTEHAKILPDSMIDDSVTLPRDRDRLANLLAEALSGYMAGPANDRWAKVKELHAAWRQS